MLARRQLFDMRGDIYRLLDVEVRGSRTVAHVISITDRKALPIQVDWLQIKDSTAKPDPVMAVRAQSSRKNGTTEGITPSEATRDLRWNAIKPLVGNTKIYYRRYRGQLILNQAKSCGVSDRTITPALRMYWQGGMIPDALMGNFHRCGPRGAVTPNRGHSLGRPVKGNRYKPYVWKADLLAKVSNFIIELYLKSKNHSKAFCFRRAISKFFSTGIGKYKQPLPLGERPSQSQINYILEKSITAKQLLIRQDGRDVFAKDHAPKTRSAKTRAACIGIFEIDATTPDVIIVADDDQTVAIGKATLYLIVDAKSYLIVGFHLTLDNCSWDSAKEAILSISEDKRELCSKWGVEYRESDWPAHGKWPILWRADRGPELTGYDSDCLAEGLEGAIETMPKNRANFKPFVESGFKFIQRQIRCFIGGYTPPEDFGKRQIDNPSKKATRTLKGLGRELLEKVILWNTRSPKAKRIDASLADLKDGYTGAPTEVWKREEENFSGALTSYDPTFLTFKLLPSESNFKLKTSGVYRDGLRWVPSERDKDTWLLSALDTSLVVTATFRRNLVDYIYVHNPQTPGEWTTMHLAETHAKFAGMTFDQAKTHMVELLAINDALEQGNLSKTNIQEDAALDREKKAQRNKSKLKRERPKGAKSPNPQALRERQARASRVAHAVLPSNASASPTSPPPLDSLSAPAAATTGSAEIEGNKVNASLSLLFSLRKAK